MADFKLGRIKFKWKGNWAINTAYVKDDIVKFNANSFVCITNHTSSGNTDGWFLTDFANWQTYVPGLNPTGVYSAGTKYYVNDIATYNGTSFISLTNANIGNTPSTSPSSWIILAQGNPDMTTANVYYVSTAGSNSNDGKTISTSFRTLRYACDSISGPASIYVKAGVYEEQLPITVPPGVSIIGDGMRDTEVKPLLSKVATTNYLSSGSIGTVIKVVSNAGILAGMTVTGTAIGSNRTVVTTSGSDTVVLNTAPSGTPTNNQSLTFTQTNLSTDASPKANNLSTMFLLSDSTMIHQLLMTGMSGFTPSLVTPSDITLATIGGVFCALNPASPVTTKSPYIKDCTAKSTGGIGAMVDGSVQASGNRSMVLWAFNQVHDDGVGIWVKDNGKCEAVSCFTYYAYFGYAATGGGKIRSLSGNNSYGTYGGVSRGYSSTESPVTGTVYGGMLTFNGAASTGIFQVGETITQATSAATGTITSVQNGFLYYKAGTGTFNTTNLVTGGTSAATMTPTAVGGQSGYLLVLSGLTALPVAGASIEFATGDTSAYVIQSVSGSYVNSSSKIIVTLAQQKAVASVDGVTIRIRYNFSQIRLTGHDFLSIGTGNTAQTNYPDIPLQSAVPSNETVNVFPGRVYYVTTDQDGNFRVGPYFAVNQATGRATLNASAFDLSGLTSLRLGTVGAQLGAQVDEFSTDGTMGQNSAVKVPTQSAVRTYLGAAYQSISPVADLTYDLGTPSKRWGHLYVGPGSITLGTITLSDSSGTLAVTSTSTGNMTVPGDLNVTGNITFGGSSTVINSTNLTISDPLIYLGTGNSANLNDLGFMGHFTAASVYQHTGLVRQASTNTWMLFSGVTSEPANTVPTTDGTFVLDPLKIGALTATTGAFSSALTFGTAGALRFTATGGTNYVGFVAPATIASNVTWTLPSADSTTPGFALVSNGSGVLSWAAAGAVLSTDTSSSTLYPAMSTSATGNFTAAKVNSGLTFNGVTGVLTTVGSIINHTGTVATGALVVGDQTTPANGTSIYLRSTSKAAINWSGTGVLAFNGAGDGSTERARFDAAGVFKKTVATSTGVETIAIQFWDGTNNVGSIRSYNVNAYNQVMRFYSASGIGSATEALALTLDQSGNTIVNGTLTETSSIVYKENVNPITDALDTVMKLVGVTYDRKNGSSKNEAGLIAEDVDKVLPNLVRHNTDGSAEGIQYTKLTAYLIEAIKTLKAEIDELKGNK